MIVLDVTPILNVTSLRDSFEWFERLGWKKHWEHGDPPTFGAVISGHSEIFLCQGCQGTRGGPMPKEPWTISGEHVDELVAPDPGMSTRPTRSRSQQGVTAPWPPTDMPWNVRECHIRHPDGHTIRIGAHLSE
jgi:hypothetical protein